MAKSSIIIAPITFVLVLISALLNSVCCLISPFFAILLGLAAGALCCFFEKPAGMEKAVVRGAIAGVIAGAAALIAQTIGETAAAMIIASSGMTPEICLPGLCELASAPASQTSWIIGSVFSACFCGLMLLAVMGGLGAAGGAFFYRFVQTKVSRSIVSQGGNTIV